MIERHLMKLRARHDISTEEEDAVRALIGEVKEHPADTVIIKAGQQLQVSTLLIDGLLARAYDLQEGGRQITEHHVGGDFADLHSYTLKRLDHDIVTMTKCRIALVSHEQITRLLERHPRLARVYWFSTNLDAAIHRMWEVSLGRRRASPRMAHLFCELHVRLGMVGLTDGDSFHLPLTQDELADCLGLTAVHVNRTLKELRERQLVDFRSGKVILRDLAGLKELAEFDPAYLYLERQPV